MLWGGYSFVMIRLDFDRSLATEWKEALEAHFRRELGSRGISAGDFGHQEVEVCWPDHSVMRFQFAFVVVDHARKKFAVFTEHCGYWEFPCEGFTVEVLRRKYIALAKD
jgi:hypothetical protein